MRPTPPARLLLAGLATVALVTGPTAMRATADSPQLPVVTSVTYGAYESTDANLRADTLTVDWAGSAPGSRIYTTSMAGATIGTSNGTFASRFSDAGTPRTRLSYRGGVCDPVCSGSGLSHITWGAWNHPPIPAAVNGAPPSLTATPGTKASPGMKITVSPGGQAGAPVFLIFNFSAVIARLGPGDLHFVDTYPYAPQNSYTVAACYADCDRPEWPYWGDVYKPVSAHSPVVKAYTANTPSCKLLAPGIYRYGLNWRNACKP